MIKIDENWHIETDAYSFKLVNTVEGKIKKETGLPGVSVRETWHPTISACLKWYCSESTKVCEDVKAVMCMITGVNAKLDRL